MFRWTLTFVALITLSRVATADDDFITEQPSDTGTAAEAEPAALSPHKTVTTAGDRIPRGVPTHLNPPEAR